jgi:hypothetical protein
VAAAYDAHPTAVHQPLVDDGLRGLQHVSHVLLPDPTRKAGTQATSNREAEDASHRRQEIEVRPREICP